MVINKYSLGIIFVILTIGSLMFNGNLVQDTSSSLNNGDQFDNWRPSNSDLSSQNCGLCHNVLTTTVATGSLNITGSTTVDAYSTFTLSASVSGFTESQNDKMVIGFNSLDDNNSLFSVQSSTAKDYKSSINVDASGNSNAVDFSLTAPAEAGSYTVLAYAVHATEDTTFYYLSKSVSITVNAVADTIPPVIDSMKLGNTDYTANMELRGTTTLNVQATDLNMAKVQYTTDNTTYTDMAYNSSLSLYQATITSTDYQVSTLVLSVVATDKGGNNATSVYVFAVNNTGLTPTADIVTYKVDESVLVNDGKIDSVWDNVPQTSISEFGSGGFIKTVQDGTYLYTLMAYESSMTWVSVEFNVSADNPEFMGAGTYGWVFGTGADNEYYGDYYFIGTSGVPQRNTKDVVFFEKITEGTTTYIESARLLEIKDNDGFDFEFTKAQTFTAAFASNVHHTDDHKVLTWIITDLAPSGQTPQPQAKITPSINLQQVSDGVFVFSVVIVIVTVFVHISLRVVSKPIKHERRIVYSNKIPNHPGSIPLIKQFLSTQKNKIFKPKSKVEKKE